MAKMETDQKSVFYHGTKTSPSPSIELLGYRNQYLMELEAQPDNLTALKVKAHYEEVTPGGTIVEVGEEEVTEIEHRLIQAISASPQSASQAQGPQKTTGALRDPLTRISPALGRGRKAP